MDEHRDSRESRDSLDVINNAIIKETFLGYTEEKFKEGTSNNSNTSINNTKQDKTDCCLDKCCCCIDDCCKWWFFHCSFQIPSQSIIEDNLLNKSKQYYCCDLCSECLEIKLANYCASNKCVKEYCSDCFYNGCYTRCCCFTFILTPK
jgi:hypothetical protein